MNQVNEANILTILELYERKLAKFKREMRELGIKVKVSASIGKWTSIVEEV